MPRPDARLEVLIEADALRARIGEMAAAIRRDVGPGVPVHLVGVLKGAFILLADLVRALDDPVTCDFIAVSSYGPHRSSSGEVRLTKDLDVGLAGRDVVLVEDIVDTGATLAYLIDVLRARRPRSLRTLCLLDKAARRRVPVTVDYCGFHVEDRFVVGYGLDWDERYRNLPMIAALV
ncbi:MAG TPA: hypoxanthine phosphoribosyltransferase [Vicinamibacterales bacterium]|jgi:hypoxanthine phosphoribosyltransferase|nr:hypoxanthine phosphoribosyltransferase [Vicinamibacterales bacterium]